MKKFYTEKWAYDLNANLKLIAVIEQLNNEYVLKMMSHILNAQYFWTHRILRRELEYGVWDVHEPNQLKALAIAFNQTNKEVLEQFDLDDELIYKTIEGEKLSSSINDVIYHVLNHSNYHRGQIVKELKALGSELPDTNYISFKRE
jgi:uncharacterized damage-inducible protein DinB